MGRFVAVLLLVAVCLAAIALGWREGWRRRRRLSTRANDSATPSATPSALAVAAGVFGGAAAKARRKAAAKPKTPAAKSKSGGPNAENTEAKSAEAKNAVAKNADMNADAKDSEAKNADKTVVAAKAPRRPPLPRSNADVVVDTLNLTHWRKGGGGPISPADIAETISATAPILREKYAGKVMYVVKDRESVLNDPETRRSYQELSKNLGVHINVVERYEDPPRNSSFRHESHPAAAPGGHAARGRDDFYMALLAWRNRCDVMSNDRFRDFDEFRFAVDPFHVYEFAYWRELPEREYVRPEAERVGRPRSVPYPAALKPPKNAGRADASRTNT